MPSREALLARVSALAEDVDQTPTADQWDDHTEYSRGDVQRRFGSWNAFVEAAGLDPNREFRSRIELLALLRDLRDEFGQRPTQAAVRDHSPVSVTTFQRRFDSWADALREAGLRPPASQATREELIGAFREVEQEIGKVPSRSDMLEHGDYSASPYESRWGSWSEAKNEISERVVEQ